MTLYSKLYLTSPLYFAFGLSTIKFSGLLSCPVGWGWSAIFLEVLVANVRQRMIRVPMFPLELPSAVQPRFVTREFECVLTSTPSGCDWSAVQWRKPAKPRQKKKENKKQSEIRKHGAFRTYFSASVSDRYKARQNRARLGQHDETKTKYNSHYLMSRRQHNHTNTPPIKLAHSFTQILFAGSASFWVFVFCSPRSRSLSRFRSEFESHWFSDSLADSPPM